MYQTIQARKFFKLAVKQAENLKRIKHPEVKRQQQRAILKTLLAGLKSSQIA